VNRGPPKADLEREAFGRARRVAENSPEALRMAKIQATGASALGYGLSKPEFSFSYRHGRRSMTLRHCLALPVDVHDFTLQRSMAKARKASRA
jgi:hypothetical protein